MLLTSISPRWRVAQYGRAADAGKIRIHHGDGRLARRGQVDLRWFGDDLTTARKTVSCWSAADGSVLVSTHARDFDGAPCVGGRPQPQPNAADEVCMYHAVRAKHRPEIARMRLDRAGAAALAAAEYVALTPHGMWLPPVEGNKEGTAAARAPRLLAAGSNAPRVFDGSSFRRYVRHGLNRSYLVAGD